MAEPRRRETSSSSRSRRRSRGAAEAGPLDGKILVDATNNVSGGPGGLEIAALAPEARYVKAFNTIFATFMHDTPPERPASLVLSGDDEEAKRVVSGLVADLGFDPVDVGGAERRRSSRRSRTS